MKNLTKFGLYTIMAGMAGTYALNSPAILRLFSTAGAGFPSELIFHTLTGIGGAMAAWHFTPDKIKSWKYEKLFLLVGLKVRVGKIDYAPKLMYSYAENGTEKLYFTLPKGLSSEDFKKKELALQEALRVEGLTTRYINGKIEMLLKHNKLLDKYPFELIPTRGTTEIVIGYSKDGIVKLRLDDSYVHLLVGGLTGYGKSTFIMAALTGLILTKDPKKLKFYISDMKRIDLPVFEKCQHVHRYADTADDTFKMLKEIQTVMYDRLDTLKRAGVNHIKEYRGHMERVIVVIDELACLMGNKQAYRTLQDIASKSRAVGIHLILCTQRPEADVVPGLLKAQLPATLAFRTRNIVNSQILLDNKNATELKVKGRAILQTDKETEVQVMHITPQQVQKMIKHTYVEKPKEKQDKTDGVISLADFQRLANN